MKLIFCAKCQDVFKPKRSEIFTVCECGKSKGRYLDSVQAEYSGPCVPVGFSNSSFGSALLNQPFSGAGKEFTAFVIPKNCSTFTKIEEEQ